MLKNIKISGLAVVMLLATMLFTSCKKEQTKEEYMAVNSPVTTPNSATFKAVPILKN